MSLIALAGALLLAAATIPQAAKLARDRHADGLHGGFAALNLAGLLLLGWRSLELREWAFLGVNLLAAAFWLGVLALKVGNKRTPRASAVGMRRAETGRVPRGE